MTISNRDTGSSIHRSAHILVFPDRFCANYRVTMASGSVFRRRYLMMALAGVAVIGGGLATSGGSLLRYIGGGREVSFSRDIRPILNQNCVQCHGGVRQKNGVSFIFRGEALGVGKSGRRTIIPGDPNASELIARVTSRDPDARMPYHAPPLPPSQIALLRRWIKERAKWEDHWAFVAPQPQPLPAVKQSTSARQPESRFILARLELAGLAPSPDADNGAFVPRLYVDLTGLPP